jgi:TolB-like protein
MSGEDATESLLFDGLKLNRRGLFRLDPTGKTAPVAIGSRALDLLLLLAGQAGAVVSKRDLMAGAWPGIAVEESNLTKQISALRRALDRNSGMGSYIQTVPGRGYRFAAAVTRACETGATAPKLTPPEKPSIAVLPFHNMTGDSEQEYFVDGIVEEIITAIARFPGLFVIARNSSFTYKDKTVDVRQVARELGVRYVLEGGVRKSGNRVRITSQLIDTRTAAHIWTDRFSGTLDDIFELQEQIASSVAGTLEPRLELAEIERASRKSTESLDAYDTLLRAIAQARKRTSEAMAEAVRLAHRALEIEPGYAPAMARVAMWQHMRRARHWIPSTGAEIDEAIGMARQALVIGVNDPSVLDLAGVAISNFTGDTGTALAALDRAITLNPNFAAAFGHRSMILGFINQPDEAILSAHQAIRLSPLDPVTFAFCNALALAHLIADQYEEGLIWADRAARENSGLPALRLTNPNGK